jgi:hypothetical protein
LIQWQWLFDSDPSIRWQGMRELIGSSAEEVAAERAQVATEGAGARLLALQGTDGRCGVEPRVELDHARPDAVERRRSRSRKRAGTPRAKPCPRLSQLEGMRLEGMCNAFFEGELEPCINGQVVAVGAYFGQDVRGIIARLLAEQLPDGSWNCEAAHRSMRSSFNTTICVIEALLAYEHAGGAVRR